MTVRAHTPIAAGLAALAALGGCGVAPAQTAEAGKTQPQYLGVNTRLMDSDLVDIRVAVRQARGPQDVLAYARCAAAQYTLIRGYGYARHVRTNVTKEGGIWHGDAVYTISPELPKGLETIDAAKTVRGCDEQGIPTV